MGLQFGSQAEGHMRKHVTFGDPLASACRCLFDTYGMPRGHFHDLAIFQTTCQALTIAVLLKVNLNGLANCFSGAAIYITHTRRSGAVTDHCI